MGFLRLAVCPLQGRKIRRKHAIYTRSLSPFGLARLSGVAYGSRRLGSERESDVTSHVPRTFHLRKLHNKDDRRPTVDMEACSSL